MYLIRQAKNSQKCVTRMASLGRGISHIISLLPDPKCPSVLTKFEQYAAKAQGSSTCSRWIHSLKI